MRRSPTTPPDTPKKRRGSVLIIVVITLMFAATALVAFMEKATNDLLVDHREVLGRRLRIEAYSALETTLAVLQDFKTVGGALRSPAEGWADPLGFAGYVPGEGRRIVVTFEDESGKISLPRATPQILQNLFETWEVPRPDAEMLADALMGWMKREHVYSTSLSPDYDTGELPFDPPARPLRSYSELAAIDKVREFFYDANGLPNEYWLRFVAAVSLFDYERPNINGAKPDTLAAVGQFDESQRQALGEYVSGQGSYEVQGPNFFRNAEEAAMIVGPGGNTQALGTEISALRIFVTVYEGKSEFRVAAVVSWPNGATPVRQTAVRAEVSASPESRSGQGQRPPRPSREPRAAADQTGAQANLRYPFTILEIRENDEIPAAPAPPPANPPL